MKVCIAGQGAFGIKHIEAIQKISGIEIATLAGRQPGLHARGGAEVQDSALVHQSRRVPRSNPASRPRSWPRRRRCTPSKASSACAPANTCRSRFPWPTPSPTPKRWRAYRRKPASSAWAATRAASIPRTSGCARRSWPARLKIQQMDVQTYFFRRSNMNALGKPRSWTDHLLWHHACHTVDLFQYQTGETASVARAVQGPLHPELKIAMDMSIQMKVPGGAICTLSLSFNNDGPLGTFFRYICDNGTYIARYDDLIDGKEQQDRRVEGGRVDERHRAAGPRVLRGHQGKARAQRRHRSRCFPRCGRSTPSRSPCCNGDIPRFLANGDGAEGVASAPPEG